MRLPSGRTLYYHKPHVGRDGEITYWGEEMGQWVKRRTWGGTLAENATQAVARDVMAEAMMRAWTRLKAIPLMTVHDELVYALPVLPAMPLHQHAQTELLKNLMLEPPVWAGGLPIAGEAKTMTRYGVKMV
jgi:DNA polymerase